MLLRVLTSQPSTERTYMNINITYKCSEYSEFHIDFTRPIIKCFLTGYAIRRSGKNEFHGFYYNKMC